MRKYFGTFFFCLFATLWIFSHATVRAEEPTQIRTEGEALVSRVAPGEFLPISIKLFNFGSGKRVDVFISYEIIDSGGNRITAIHETVAVETTASFVKTIQIPLDTPAGTYSAKSSIVYEDQVIPTTSQFPFTVEPKIAGFFRSEFYVYGGIVALSSIVAGFLGHLWIRRRRTTRLTPFDYDDIPRDERIFFELISDTIAHMRSRVGDTALDIAKNIDDLVIDEKSGRVLELKKDPAKIMALLILNYEKLLGQKVSFALHRSDENAKRRLSHIDKNLITIHKYFE